ncbi:hotdog family protein [Falsiroseomonas stagni]|uniref:Acyl dehydratase n=1 Tax=Falsiroseomonas stagni DSM 19981 TaxID=1123062 RepID=A0A1I4AFE9_9PROT|nr:acyl dehydratase [Falsiroseomonas stagni]SFK55185.1 hypothetical protein SAMN02745775_103422 [Falsiroseomonas stagni DSM 19981]
MPATTTPCFEDVAPGDALPPLVKGPLRTAHLMRWSAAMENWHRIHYDRDFAIGHDRLPDILVNGSFKQQFIVQCLKDWAGPRGWLWKVSYQFRGMDVVDEVLTVQGHVAATRRAADYGLVEVEFGILNRAGKDNTPGRATIALPYRGGPAVPYPFVPPRD